MVFGDACLLACQYLVKPAFSAISLILFLPACVPNAGLESLASKITCGVSYRTFLAFFRFPSCFIMSESSFLLDG
ncbi:MAG: hypothetical protein WKF36_10995 [Candidatus Nitrosocosmicus sp.]